MIDAGYFDGGSSRRHAVQLQRTAAGLQIDGDGWQRTVGVDAVRISEALGGAPRTLAFGDGSYCEVAQGPGLDGLLAALGHRESAVVRWQRSWRIAAISVAAVALLLTAGYRWGLPWAAAHIAPRLPPALVAELSSQVMRLLDARALTPSRLPPARRQALEAAFARLAAQDGGLDGCRLLFRRGAELGPNAFALPDGRVVVLDELVDLAAGDDEVLAVLAHELGHVKHRHGLRQSLQSSVVAAVAAGWFGDVSSLFAGFSALLLESAYSRGFELEADAYGARLMLAQGGSPQALATMLEKLEKAHEARQAGAMPAAADWLSTHPETAERVSRLRAMR